MNKYKNLIRIIALLMLTCVLTCLTLVGSYKGDVEEEELVIVKASSNPNLSITYSSENGYVTPNTSNTITFNFKLDAAPVSDVSIVFHAEDVTAISEAGDYYYISDDFSDLADGEKVEKTHDNTTITLNSSNYNGVTVSYQVSKATYACKGPDGEYLYNYFNFVIDSIEGATYVGEDKFKCRLAYEAFLEMSKDSNGYYYYAPFRKECYNSFSFDTLKGFQSGASVPSPSECETTINRTLCNDFGSSLASIYNNTIAKGWGQFNMCAWMEHMGSTCYAKGDTIFNLYFAGDMTNKSLVIEEIGCVNKGGENYSDNDNENMDFDEVSTQSKYTEKEYWKDNKYHTKTYYKVPTDWGYSYSIYVNNWYGTYKRWGNGNTKERLSDDVAPELEETYVNLDTLMIDGKIRLILRFSELVDGHDLQINAYLGGNKGLVFRYVEGAGTNTLVYEYSLKTSEFMTSSLVYTNIVLDSVSGKVYDLGYNWETKSVNSLSIKYEQEKRSINIDLRKPQLSDATTTKPSEVTKTRSVVMTVSEVSSGMLYYCWSKEKDGDYDDASDFKNIIKSGETTRYAGAKTLELEDSGGSTTVSIGSPLGLDGGYYLHVLVLSEFGKQVTKTFGVEQDYELASGYLFDNTSPNITVTKSDDTTQLEKIYNFTSNDNFASGITESPSGISLIGIKIYEESLNEVKDICLWDETSNVKLYETGDIDDGVWSGTFKFSIDSETLTMKVKSTELIKLADIGYGSYSYYFYVQDKAGNTSIIDGFEYISEKYDSRTQFASSWTASKENLYSEVDGQPSTGIEENVYDINQIAGQPLSFTFNNIEADNDTIATDVMSLLKLYYGSKSNVVYTKDSGSYDEYITVETVTNGKKTDLKITPLKVGFYKFEFIVTRTLTNDDTSSLYSNEDFEFYVTDRSFNNSTGQYNYENTTNYLNSLGDLALINKVYQLSNSYYYMNSTEKVTAVSYNNCASPASFSSEAYALEYIKYMEYQDLQLCVIDSQIAAFLASDSGGSTKYQKADGQGSVVPLTGQTWIRYKRSSWNENSGLEGWAYYYYSSRSETTINISLLNSNCPLLVNALNSVADYLLKKGSWVYLTEEEYFDKNNCPTLAEGQIHKNTESVDATMIGSPYSVILSFDGDTGMYKNTTEYNDEQVTIASSLVLDLTDVKKLYYLDESDNSLVPIKATEGQTLVKALGNKVGSGQIRLIELDGTGTREFYVMLDCDAPVVNISWKVTGNNASSSVASNDLNSRNDGEVYSAKTMTISSSKATSELDPLAYVAIYTAPQYQFVSITYYKDLSNNPIELENGNYYVVIGDRYGNTYSFKAQVCDTDLEVTAEVVDRDGVQYVFVKTNRTEDQIERYEVRCNNILSTKEYNENGVKYTDDGYYNIYIKDIYGYTNSTNGEFGENLTFERPLPTITWYYINSNGTPVLYDASTTTCMNITEASESNTFYINTSKTLRFVYTGEYSYSISGISESCIEASSNSHYVNINSNENWTLKIWYTEYPNVVATYVCTNDTQAPTVTCTYKYNTYELAESDLMNATALNSALNSYYYLDSVKFTKTGTESMNIVEGDYVNTNLISVKVTDDAGIGSVVVYLDGEVYKEYLDVNGTFDGCSLSRTGVYKIVATDGFGNEKVLNFSNGQVNTVRTYIDDVEIANANTKSLYGNSSATFTISECGTIYVKVGNYSLLYSLRNGKLVYTRYVNTDIGGGTKSFELDVKQKQELNDEGVYEDVDDAFFDMYSEEFKKDVFYEFEANNETVKLSKNYKELDGFKFYVSYDSNNYVTIKFVCDDENPLSVDLSFLDENLNPYCYTFELSKETTDIELEDNEGKKISCEDGKVVRTNGNFEIVTEGENNNLSEISEITYSYSPTKEFIEYSLIFEKQKFVTDLNTEENGFYSFMITNKFGNTINYIINRSDVYTILGYAIYDDYVESSFDSNYGEELIKANSKVRFEAYTDLDDRNTFVLTKDGSTEPINFAYTYDNGYYTFTIEDAGVYKLTATDSYGNVIVKNFEINKSNIEYNDSYLTGFNQDALLLSQGYTNKMLTIDLASITSDDIHYVSTITSTEDTVKGYRVVYKTEKILYNTLTQDAVGLNSKYAWVINYEYTYYTDNPTITGKTKTIVDLLTGEILEDNEDNKLLVKTNNEYSTKFESAIGRDGDNDYQVVFRDSYGSIAKKEIHYKATPTLTITKHIRSEISEQVVDINDAVIFGIWSSGSVSFDTTSKNFVCTSKDTYNGTTDQVNTMPLNFSFSAENTSGTFIYSVDYQDEYGNKYTFDVRLIRRNIDIDLVDGIETQTINDVETTRNNIQITYSTDTVCSYRLDSGEEIIYNNEVLYKDGTYRFQAYDDAGNITTRVIRKDTTCEFEFSVGTTGKTLINGDVVNSGTVRFESADNDTSYIKAIYRNNELQENNTNTFSKDGLWTLLIEDEIGNIQLFEFNIITHKKSEFSYTTPFTYKIVEFWYNSGDGVLINSLDLITHTDDNSSFNIKENGTYTVVMSSSVYKNTIDFEFTIDTSVPQTALVGCEEGERTNNDITFDNVNEGDIIEIYKDGELYSKVEITEKGDIPTITEGGNYKVVLTNEAGVSTTLTFVRNDIINSAGSALVIVIGLLYVVGIIVAAIIHNHQKIDE